MGLDDSAMQEYHPAPYLCLQPKDQWEGSAGSG